MANLTSHSAFKIYFDIYIHHFFITYILRYLNRNKHYIIKLNDILNKSYQHNYKYNPFLFSFENTF